MSRRSAVAARALPALVLAPLGFAWFQAPVREFETRLAAGLLRVLGAQSVTVLFDTSIQVFSARGGAFRAVVTPACSALASVLALVGLAVVVPRATRSRRALAVGAAIGAVFVGNILRIAGSVAVGFAAGRSSLVLFHDWVGGAFTFLYTLGGFMLMLWVLLPADGPAEIERREVDLALA